MTPFELRSENAAKFRIGYPEFLPISEKAAEIRDLWSSHQLIILGGATGSGKTTQLPKIALEIGCGRHGMIGCTQPRRLAATAMARRLSLEMNCEYGNAVGSQVRFEDRSSAGTVLKFMTDGILLAELRNDPLLRRYDCLIIDEAHERTLNIDFLLGVIRNLLHRRKDLKIAISSATLDLERFSKFFHNAPVITVSGRTFPVEDIFLVPFEDEELPEHVARAERELYSFDPMGDILVFLPGEREIRECTEMLNGKKLKNTEILPLYSRLSSAEQQKVFQSSRFRRIILSTNVAETSLTIPGIKFCIDSGMARISRYNPRTRIQELQIEMISQASANQRRGRCGRTSDGICIHLYSEEDLQRSAPYTDPEIKRSSLAGVILQMATLRLPDIRTFAFIDPPSPALIREGFRTLSDIQAIDSAGKVLPDGKMLAQMPVDPHLGRMLLASSRLKTVPELLVLCAGLSLPEIKERPTEKTQAADQAHSAWKDDSSDFISILKLWNDLVSSGAFASNGALRRFAKKNFINFTRAREWKNLVQDLADSIRYRKSVGEVDLSCYEAIHEAILCGIPRNIAKIEPDQSTRLYRGTDGRKFTIFPGSGLAKRKKLPEWIAVFALVETSRVFGRTAAVIDPAVLERAAGHLCSKVYDQEHFESSSGFVRAREKVMLGSLLIHAGRKVDFARYNPAAAHEIFIREGLLAGQVLFGGRKTDEFNRIRKKLLEYEIRMRKEGFLYDCERAAEFFRENLPESVNSAKALKDFWKKDGADLNFSEENFMLEDSGFTAEDFPGEMVFDGVKYALVYKFEPGDADDGAVLCVPENALNLLPDRVIDYPVPGFFADFAEVMLRALPKNLRRTLGGIVNVAEDFSAALKLDPALRELPPPEALADFLRDELDMEINPREFESAQIPAFMKIKLGVLNDRGRLIKLLDALPDRSRRPSQLSARLPGAERHRVSGWSSWDAADGIMPEKIELPTGSGRFFYPALTPDKESCTVSKQLFLKQSEARRIHRQGVCKLFMMENASMAKFLKRSLKLSNELKLSLMVNYSREDFENALLEAAVVNAAQSDFYSIRSAENFSRFSQQLLPLWSDNLDELCGELENFTTLIQEIKNFIRRAKNAAENISEHLDFLFAPGFLERPAVWSDYRRYLRALKLRAQRAADAPGKDMEKAQNLYEWEERFNAALNSVKDLTDSDGLYEFWELLEECRIATFAPEIKTAVKSPFAKLEKLWDSLRI